MRWGVQKTKEGTINWGQSLWFPVKGAYGLVGGGVQGQTHQVQCQCLPAKKVLKDVPIIVRNLPLGTRSDEVQDQIVWNELKVEEDRDKGVTKEQKIMEMFMSITSSILEFLEFTMEVSSWATNLVPCIDTKIGWDLPEEQEQWYTGGHATDQETPGTQWKHRSDRHTIPYKFYTKPVTNSITTLQRSVMQENMKVATFFNEIIRRLKTSSTGVGSRTRRGSLGQMMGDLETIGYTGVLQIKGPKECNH